MCTFVLKKEAAPMIAMLFKWFLLSGLVLPNLLSSEPIVNAAHPFYVSVTEINHNNKEKTLEISCKIFADDMEETLKNNYKTTVDLTNKNQQQLIDRLLNDYIQKHLSLITNGKTTSLKYVGFEKESESVYCYFEVQNVPAFKTLDIKNSILHDYKEEQINILHVTVNGNRKSYKLDYPNKQVNFTF
jgi:hypothetical protein